MNKLHFELKECAFEFTTEALDNSQWYGKAIVMANQYIDAVKKNVQVMRLVGAKANELQTVPNLITGLIYFDVVSGNFTNV